MPSRRSRAIYRLNRMRMRAIFHHRISRWLAKQLGWGLIVSGVAVAQWDEYAAALVLFVAGCTILLFRGYHWNGIDGWPKATRGLRRLWIVAAFTGMVASWPVTVAKKGDKPWSSLWGYGTTRQGNLHILYDNEALDGRKITANIRAIDPNQATLFALQPFQFNNSGETIPKISVHLYFSVPIDLLTVFWISAASDESNFPSSFVWNTRLTDPPISRGETWSITAFQGNKVRGFTEPITAKLKVFYGTNRPAEATFTISPSSADLQRITEARRRGILDKLAGFIQTGNKLREGMNSTDETLQRRAAMQIPVWHKTIEEYLQTIPRGNIYFAEFQNQILNSMYPYGLKITDGKELWDMLVSDLSRLNEFIKDPDLGKF
jgi:hypothetical protein